MNLDDLTLGQAKQLVTLLGPGVPTPPEQHPYSVGSTILLQTVTWAYTGRLVAVTAREFVLEDVARIYDFGRFSEALKTGKLSEVEPFPDGPVIITREGTEVSCWPHPLPREVK